jgi:hypothetical protein
MKAKVASILLFSVKEQRESKRRAVQLLLKDLTVGVVPFTAEKEVL